MIPIQTKYHSQAFGRHAPHVLDRIKDMSGRMLPECLEAERDVDQLADI
jgi:hypothetical protein